MRQQDLIQGFTACAAPWLSGAQSEDPIALGCRVMFRRNLVGHPFPLKASVAVRRRLQLNIAEAVATTEVPHGGWTLDLTTLSSLDRLALCERRLSQLSPAAPAEGCALFVNADQSLSITSNDQDHVCVQGVRPGANLWKLYCRVAELDAALAEELEYAYTPPLGYLTAQPEHVGTGLRAGVVLHLPGLLLAEQMDQVANAIDQMHLSMRSVFVNDEEACGNLYEVANRSTLGESAETIVRRLCKVTGDLITQERRARQVVMRERSLWVCDYVSRANALLRHAFRLDSSEAVNLLSAVRLGVDLGMLPRLERQQLDRLTLLSQSGHLQKHLGRELDIEERNAARAALVRELLESADHEG